MEKWTQYKDLSEEEQSELIAAMLDDTVHILVNCPHWTVGHWEIKSTVTFFDECYYRIIEKDKNEKH